MTVFVGPNGVQTYRALAIKHGLALYAKTGLKPNSAYTPEAMLYAAGEITGKTFKRRQYAEAIAALDEWLAVNGTTGEEA
jgi:hypothetical protein